MDVPRDADDLDTVELTEDEKDEYLQAECRRLLGMELAEFIQRRDDGEFPDPDNPKIAPMTLLLSEFSR
ncbi:MAG TPA: hypothetical protein VIL44_00220 [Micromonospora sp.]